MSIKTFQTPALLIEALRGADGARMEVLYETSVKANPQGFIQDLSYHGSMADFADTITLQGGTMLVAKVDGKVVGMGALRPMDNVDEVEICKLHVHPDYQGKGLGRGMLEQLMVEAAARGFKTAKLHVTTSQMKAIGLYKSQGFEELQTGMWKGEYNGQPMAFETMHMQKKL